MLVAPETTWLFVRTSPPAAAAMNQATRGGRGGRCAGTGACGGCGGQWVGGGGQWVGGAPSAGPGPVAAAGTTAGAVVVVGYPSSGRPESVMMCCSAMALF